MASWLAKLNSRPSIIHLVIWLTTWSNKILPKLPRLGAISFGQLMSKLDQPKVTYVALVDWPMLGQLTKSWSILCLLNLYARNTWILEDFDHVFLMFHCIGQVKLSCLLFKLIEWSCRLLDHLRLFIILIKAFANGTQNSIMQYDTENACLTKVYAHKTWSFRQGCHSKSKSKLSLFIK